MSPWNKKQLRALGIMIVAALFLYGCQSVEGIGLDCEGRSGMQVTVQKSAAEMNGLVVEDRPNASSSWFMYLHDLGEGQLGVCEQIWVFPPLGCNEPIDFSEKYIFKLNPDEVVFIQSIPDKPGSFELTRTCKSKER
jgi:hypothetical protein